MARDVVGVPSDLARRRRSDWSITDRPSVRLKRKKKKEKEGNWNGEFEIERWNIDRVYSNDRSTIDSVHSTFRVRVRRSVSRTRRITLLRVCKYIKWTIIKQRKKRKKKRVKCVPNWIVYMYVHRWCVRPRGPTFCISSWIFFTRARALSTTGFTFYPFKKIRYGSNISIDYNRF